MVRARHLSVVRRSLGWQSAFKKSCCRRSAWRGVQGVFQQMQGILQIFMQGLQTCMRRVPDLTRSDFCHEVGWRRGVGRRRLGVPRRIGTRTLTDPLRRGGALKGCLSGQNESAPCLSTESKIGEVCKFYKYSLRCSLLVAQICHFTARPLQVNLSTRCRLPV